MCFLLSAVLFSLVHYDNGFVLLELVAFTWPLTCPYCLVLLLFLFFVIFLFFYSICYLRPCTPAPSPVVTHVRGHKTASSHSSPLRCVPCIFIAGTVPHFLPWFRMTIHVLALLALFHRPMYDTNVDPRSVVVLRLHLTSMSRVMFFSALPFPLEP